MYVKLLLRYSMVYLYILNDKGVHMDVTTIKVRKDTTELLKAISRQRGRRESMEQVILELVDRYVKDERNGR